jgi:toxin FitB
VILLDTNVWSALNRPTENQTACDWIAKNASQIWLSTIVIGEMRAGIENPKAASKKKTLELWLADIELAYEEKILSFDRNAAHIFGTLIAQRKLAKHETKILDVQIAAQALARDCILATRNVKDFEWTGVKIVNPWEDL